MVPYFKVQTILNALVHAYNLKDMLSVSVNIFVIYLRIKNYFSLLQAMIWKHPFCVITFCIENYQFTVFGDDHLNRKTRQVASKKYNLR